MCMPIMAFSRTLYTGLYTGHCLQSCGNVCRNHTVDLSLKKIHNCFMNISNADNSIIIHDRYIHHTNVFAFVGH